MPQKKKNMNSSKIQSKQLTMSGMVLRVVEFSSGVYNYTILERFLPKNQHIQRKFMNFENWCNGKLSNTAHHFSNNVI